jgi:hypothetical protein
LGLRDWKKSLSSFLLLISQRAARILDAMLEIKILRGGM